MWKWITGNQEAVLVKNIGHISFNTDFDNAVQVAKLVYKHDPERLYRIINLSTETAVLDRMIREVPEIFPYMCIDCSASFEVVKILHAAGARLPTHLHVNDLEFMKYAIEVLKFSIRVLPPTPSWFSDPELFRYIRSLPDYVFDHLTSLRLLTAESPLEEIERIYPFLEHVDAYIREMKSELLLKIARDHHYTPTPDQCNLLLYRNNNLVMDENFPLTSESLLFIQNPDLIRYALGVRGVVPTMDLMIKMTRIGEMHLIEHLHEKYGFPLTLDMFEEIDRNPYAKWYVGRIAPPPPLNTEPAKYEGNCQVCFEECSESIHECGHPFHAKCFSYVSYRCGICQQPLSTNVPVA